jgi:hypothetical protein
VLLLVECGNLETQDHALDLLSVTIFGGDILPLSTAVKIEKYL